jgi:hypothetical protein
MCVVWQIAIRAARAYRTRETTEYVLGLALALKTRLGHWRRAREEGGGRGWKLRENIKTGGEEEEEREWVAWNGHIRETVKAELGTISWRRMGECRYSSTFFDFSTSWKWVVSFTPLPLYPLYLLDKRLGGPRSRSVIAEEKRKSYPGRWAPSPSLYRLSSYPDGSSP